MNMNRLDNIFNNIFMNSPLNTKRQKLPEVNIYQDEAGYELRFKTPGLGSEDIDISVEGSALTIASSNQEVEEFSRSFELPLDAEQESITAESKDGVTSISIQKVAAPTPRKIEVIGA